MLTVRRDGCTSGTGGRREGCLRACAQPQNPPQNHISRCWCLLKSPKRSKDTSQRSTELKLATGILYCNLCCWGCTFTSNVPDRSRWCPPPILSSDCPTWCPLNQTFQLSPGSDECTVIQGPALLRGPPGGEPHTSQVGNSRLQATSECWEVPQTTIWRKLHLMPLFRSKASHLVTWHVMFHILRSILQSWGLRSQRITVWRGNSETPNLVSSNQV